MANKELKEVASQMFYDWEEETYPEGSPLSDEARHLFIVAYCMGSTHRALEISEDLIQLALDLKRTIT